MNINALHRSALFGGVSQNDGKPQMNTETNTDKLITEKNYERDPVTHDLIGAAFEVHRELGYGFLEKVYQRAMQVELKLRGQRVELEQRLAVQYKGVSLRLSVVHLSSSVAKPL
jgi:hypothetical protein